MLRESPAYSGESAEREGLTSSPQPPIRNIIRDYVTRDRVQSADDKLLREVKDAIEAIHQAASQDTAKKLDDVAKKLDAISMVS
jgi:hypothetical protein